MPKAPDNDQSRRKFLRVEVLGNLHAEIGSASIAGGSGRFDVFDIGMYGMSFLAPKKYNEIFVPEASLKNVAIDVDGQSITVDAKVLYLGPHPSDQGAEQIRVGVEFVRIDSDAVFRLSRYIVQKANLDPEVLDASSETDRK